MVKILFNLATKKVVAINRDALPFEEQIELEGVPDVKKAIQVFSHTEQKVDEEGLPLYILEVNEFETTETTQSQIEVEDLESEEGFKLVDLPPAMVEVYADKVVSFSENPLLFTKEEVINAPIIISKEKQLEIDNFNLQLALVEQYEQNLSRDEEIMNLMLAVTELYEISAGGSL